MIPSQIEYRQTRRAFLDAYKEALGCKDCGTSVGRLDFDHRDKSMKRFKIGANVGVGWHTLRAEMNKCDVRCASCHTKRHHREGPKARRVYHKRTHCRKGHPFDESNTYRSPRGERWCRICRREWKRTGRQRKRARDSVLPVGS